MTYLIDTDVMVDFFKQKRPAQELITTLSKTATLALSALTVAELRSGWTTEQAEYLLPRLFALCDIGTSYPRSQSRQEHGVRTTSEGG